MTSVQLTDSVMCVTMTQRCTRSHDALVGCVMGKGAGVGDEDEGEVETCMHKGGVLCAH